MKQRKVIAVTGLAVRKDGTFLLTKRHQPETPIWHNKWNIPGGGLQWGETPEKGLIREFKEELGVKPTILYPQPIPVTALWYGKDTGFEVDSHILLLCYVVDIGQQKIDLTLDPEQETSEAKWFNFQQVQQIETLPLTIETIKQALDIVARRGII